MNCKKIQELILTNYLDQEMPQDKQKELESHIASCSECSEFLALAKETTIEPLANIKTDNLSQDIVWSKIQKEIQEEKQSLIDYDQAPGFLEKLKKIIFSPKPRLVWSTVAAIAMFILAFNLSHQQMDSGQNNQVQIAALNNQKVIDSQAADFEREEYLSYLLEQDDDYTGYGTSLETYFF